MRLLKPQNLIEGNWPSFCVTGFVGLRPVEICKTRLIGYLYIIIFALSYYTMVYFTWDYANEVYAEWKVVSKSMTIRRIQFVTGIVIFTLVVGYSVFNHNYVDALNSRLSKFDEKLKLLSVTFNYKMSTLAEITHITGAALFTILMGATEYHSLLTVDRTNLYILMSITNQLPQLVVSFATVPFVLMCLKVSKRNTVINDLIQTVTNPEKNLVGILSIDINNVFKVKLLREVYGLLGSVVVMVSEVYGPILLISFSTFVAAIFTHLYLAYSAYQSNTAQVDVIVEMLWMIFYLGRCIYLIEMGNFIRRQGKRTTILLHEYQTNSDHHLLKQEMESFARQVENTSVRFDVCNLFVIDYVILEKIMLGMIVYIVLLSQFKVGHL